MGIFDFFKNEKTNKFSKSDSDLLGPIHLREITISIPDEFAPRLQKMPYNPSIEWLRMIQTPEGNQHFRIEYFGDRKETDFITFGEQGQEKVIAVDVKTDKKYLIFDAYQHGAGAVLVNDYTQELKKERPTNQTFISASGGKVFQLFVSAYYNSTREHIEDELDEEGNYIYPNGAESDPESAIANAFDCFFLYGLNEQNNLTEILVAEELENR